MKDSLKRMGRSDPVVNVYERGTVIHSVADQSAVVLSTQPGAERIELMAKTDGGALLARGTVAAFGVSPAAVVSVSEWMAGLARTDARALDMLTGHLVCLGASLAKEGRNQATPMRTATLDTKAAVTRLSNVAVDTVMDLSK